MQSMDLVQTTGHIKTTDQDTLGAYIAPNVHGDTGYRVQKHEKYC